MFYRPGLDDHGLPRNPFNALITPRPIGWVASVDENGVPNLAPFSFFNGAGYEPPMVSVAFTGAKLGDLAGEEGYAGKHQGDEGIYGQPGVDRAEGCNERNRRPHARRSK